MQKRKNGIKLLVFSLLLGSGIFVFSAPVSAADFTVTTTTDETTTNSECSLREAIQNTNNQLATYSDCPAGDGSSDTINIPAGTFTLTSHLTTLTESAVVQGAGMGQTIIDGNAGQYVAIGLAGTGSEALEVNNLTVKSFLALGINASRANLIVSNVEVDGSQALNNGGLLAGIGVQDLAADNLVATIDGAYVHDLDDSASGALGGIITNTSQNSVLDISITNSTVARLNNTGGQTLAIAFTSGVFDNSFTPATTTASVSNTTVHDIVASTMAVGIAIIASTNTGTSSLGATLINSTVGKISGSTDTGFHGAAINIAGGAPAASSVVSNTITTKNMLLADNNYDGTSSNCNSVDYSAQAGGTDGTVNNNIVSQDGNLSDDGSCSSYFTHSKDQNNLTGLNSTLGPLANNGGTVPTIALLENSPAIDSGVTVAGLTTDARGVARPAGLAYDSGAYESPFTTAVTTEETSPSTSSQDTLADTGDSQTLYAIIGISSLTFALTLAFRSRMLDKLTS